MELDSSLARRDGKLMAVDWKDKKDLDLDSGESLYLMPLNFTCKIVKKLSLVL